MSALIMPGIENLTGTTTRSGLTVERMVSRRPVSWGVRCAHCNSNWTEPHASVRYAVCRNQHCSQTAAPARRSVAEVGHATPANRSRITDEARRFRADEREAEIERQQTHEQQRREYAVPTEPAAPYGVSQDLTRANDLSWGGNRDAKLYVSERMRKVSMPVEEAKRWQQAQADLFLANCRGYAPATASPATYAEIRRYFSDNGVQLADHEMLQAAFYRLKAQGLNSEKPMSMKSS